MTTHLRRPLTEFEAVHEADLHARLKVDGVFK